MDEQENQEQVAIEPEKKRRGRPAKTIQSGITVINVPKELEESLIEDGKKIKDDNIVEEPKKKRGRKPKISEDDLKEFEKANSESHKAYKEFAKKLLIVSGKIKKKRGRKKIVRRKKAINIGDVIKPFKSFKMPKIKINLSGIKLPKGLTWHDVQIWSVAMAAIIAIALAK